MEQMKKEEIQPDEKINQRNKVLYVLCFFVGLIFSYATLVPIGLIFSVILLFKKDDIKINLLGLFLIIIQILNIWVFAFIMLDMPEFN